MAWSSGDDDPGEVAGGNLDQYGFRRGGGTTG
jgi:hypothetical protein